jgi:hypothetical protein
MKDRAMIESWHKASGFDYELPDFKKEAFASAKVIESDGKPVAAALARLTVEIYGFCDPEFDVPVLRLEALKILHREISEELKAKRIKTAHAWLPPEIAKSFGRKLLKLFRWTRPHPGWPCYVKEVY